jgi:hypothetical protein
VHGALTDPQLEALYVVVGDGKSQRVVASAADLRRVATETKISYSIAEGILEVVDNLEGKGPSLTPDRALADLSLGLGTTHINKMLIRAQLRSLDPSSALAGQSVTALSSLLSQDTLRRDFFLLGLDKIPVVATGMKKGLAKGESVTFTFRGGKGRVAWAGAEADLPAPLDVARAFLEFNFLGGVLARQADQASATLAKAPAPGTAPPSPQKR